MQLVHISFHYHHIYMYVDSHVSVEISDGGVNQTVGQNYTLYCDIAGMSVATYQWWKDSNIILSETGSTYSFSPLRLSHAGLYSCYVSMDDYDNKEINLQSR